MSVVLVTGAGAGIGRAICAALASDGWDVVLNDVDAELAERAARELAATAAGRVVPAPGDVADASAVDALVRVAVEDLGGLDAAVANAGITTFAPFLETSREALERLLAVNVLGTWTTAQAAARAMAARGGGRLVLLSSVVAQRAMPGLAAYGMTKAAISGLAVQLAGELGPAGIAVNAVAPGATVTERTRQEQPRYADDWAAVTPSGRAGTAADVAEVVRFLLSPSALQVTGQTLVADGGWSARSPVPPGY